MEISNECIATIHYKLTDDDGELLDSSHGQEPMAYLHGGSNIVPGLEKALAGKKAGDQVTTSIAAEDAYGERDDELVVPIPKDKFHDVEQLEVGMEVELETGDDDEEVLFTVVKIEDEQIILDGNHPLAGQTLHFEVRVVEVRKATKEELDHGHAHGPGGEDHEH